MARALARRDRDLVLPPELVPAPSRLLVVAPHPDDESIGCGGTIALASSAAVVLLTGTPERRREAEAACAALGVERLEFLGLADGAVPDGGDAVGGLAAALVDFAPEVVLVPWPLERQGDHAAASRLVARAAADLPRARLWCYEVWSPLEPNRLVDIGPVVERKRAAIAAHESQVAALDYVEAALGLNRYRALLAPGAVHAEAFYECSADELLRLAEAR